MSPLPSKIGRYEIKSLIGRGGMGALYLASDPKTNRLVALKVLSETLDSSEFRARFDREVRALAAMNHPNIVNIYDYDTGELENSPFIVMEYVRGETLAEMIKRRAPLSLSQKLKLMAELCAGLAQAHEAGIIHRDIKPANLMVDQQGRLKILDFGIARVADGHGHGTRVNLPLTQVDMVIGTPGYMSPEQIEGGEVDHRSDIFAVGAMCYELISYREAFSGTTTRQIERQVLQGQPAPLGSLVPGLDPEINEIVLRALKKDPNKRYQDAATFEKALERLRLRLGADASGPLPRPAPLPPQRASRDPRAEAAHQRSLAAVQAGAPDAARRFAIEALAHDPSHAEARALLARLDSRSALPATQAASEHAASTVVPTLGGQTAPSTTAVGTSAGKAPPTEASAPTVIVAPTTAGQPKRWTRYEGFWSSDGPLRRRWEQFWKRDPASWNRQRHEPLWTRYRWPLLAIALLVLVAGIAASAVFFGLSFRPSGQLLTITKPTGGSISASGIRCGSRGADCSAMRPTGDAIELTTEADAGFEFGGYTGDCAPGGRTLMTVPRTCGATFVKTEPRPPATQTLTIAPVPTGGTLEALDIICGTKGSVCSANHPEGAPVELHATADPGFTFMGFVGDCVPLGHTQMTAPRTCGATFSPTEIANRPPPVAPSRNLARGSGRGAPSSPANDKTVPGGEGLPTPGGSVAAVGGGGGKQVVPPNINVVPTTTTVLPPISPEEFAKGKIQDVLKKYCDANVALDPVAVQRVFPTVNMVSLQNQLNKSKYNSVECKFGAPEFVKLDPEKGTAEVRAELKRVYSHTLEAKPKPDEQITDMTLSRPMERVDWQIVTMKFTPKPK